MPHLPKKHILINGLGGLFYLFVLLQWLWAALPYLPGFISFATKLQPTTPHAQIAAQTTSTQPPSIFIVLLASIISVGVLAATAYVLVKLPATIGKTGNKLTKNASDYLVPVVTHHAKMTPKKRLQLATRLVIGIKLAICILPMIIIGLSFAAATSISYDITLIVGAFLTTLSAALLGMQLLFARILHVSLKDAW